MPGSSVLRGHADCDARSTQVGSFQKNVCILFNYKYSSCFLLGSYNIKWCIRCNAKSQSFAMSGFEKDYQLRFDLRFAMGRPAGGWRSCWWRWKLAWSWGKRSLKIRPRAPEVDQSGLEPMRVFAGNLYIHYFFIVFRFVDLFFHIHFAEPAGSSDVTLDGTLQFGVSFGYEYLRLATPTDTSRSATQIGGANRQHPSAVGIWSLWNPTVAAKELLTNCCWEAIRRLQRWRCGCAGEGVSLAFILFLWA